MDSPLVPSHDSIGALANKTSKELQRSNQHNGVDVGGARTKSEFQAIWALWRLGILVKGEGLSSHKKLFEKTTRWCTDSVVALKKVVLDRRLEVGDNTKWKLVESLIRDEYKVICNPKPKGKSKRKAMVEQSDDDPKKRKIANMKAVKASTSAKITEEQNIVDVDQDEEVNACVLASAIENIEVYEHLSTDEVAIPHHTILNLLLTAIYLNVSIGNEPNQILGCPELKIDDVKQVLNNIPSFNHGNALPRFLLKSSDNERAVLSGICTNFGDLLKPATGEMELPGFPKSVHQFILTRPLPNSNPQSADYTVLFHGTPIHFLHSILHEGLKVSPVDGLLWTAAEPFYSYGYASNGGSRTQIPKPALGWKNSPEGTDGILFICQGNMRGKPRSSGSVETFNNATDIIVRYVLVLPHIFCKQGQSSIMRAHIEPTIRKAIEKMTAEEAGFASSEAGPSCSA